MSKMGYNEPPLKRKYGNVTVDAVVNGVLVHFKSKLEFRWGQHLDILKTAGEIKDFFYEFHTFRFNRDLPKEYTPDFLIRHNDNTFEYHECKGFLQKYDIDKLKAVFDERPYVKITYVFWRNPKISTHKRNLLERYCHEIIWDASKRINKNFIDMG